MANLFGPYSYQNMKTEEVTPYRARVHVSPVLVIAFRNGKQCGTLDNDHLEESYRGGQNPGQEIDKTTWKLARQKARVAMNQVRKRRKLR